MSKDFEEPYKFKTYTIEEVEADILKFEQRRVELPRFFILSFVNNGASVKKEFPVKFYTRLYSDFVIDTLNELPAYGGNFEEDEIIMKQRLSSFANYHQFFEVDKIYNGDDMFALYIVDEDKKEICFNGSFNDVNHSVLLVDSYLDAVGKERCVIMTHNRYSDESILIPVQRTTPSVYTNKPALLS